jgi:hypothetical protein
MWSTSKAAVAQGAAALAGRKLCPFGLTRKAGRYYLSSVSPNYRKKDGKNVNDIPATPSSRGNTPSPRLLLQGGVVVDGNTQTKTTTTTSGNALIVKTIGRTSAQSEKEGPSVAIHRPPPPTPPVEQLKVREGKAEEEDGDSIIAFVSPSELTFAGDATIPITSRLHIVKPGEDDVPAGTWPLFRLMVRYCRIANATDFF